MKHSGLGRESGIEAINEFLETKSVMISTASAAPANAFLCELSRNTEQV